MADSDIVRASAQPTPAAPSSDAASAEPGSANEPENLTSSAVSVLKADEHESNRLQALEADVRDQGDLERDIGLQVS